MYLIYYDEAGDDGVIGSSSLFVLSSLYLHHQNWKGTFEEIHNFRKYLKDEYSFPVKIEFHTRKFLLNKNPYRPFGFSNDMRFKICVEFAQFIASLNLNSVNVVIDKTKIKTKGYAVLDNALKYSIQRLENTFTKLDPTTKFIIITDEGRVGKMRKTSRKIQRINFIPSIHNSGSYRREIKLLIEDPLPKNSKESYFIQISDFLSYFVYLHNLKTLTTKPWGNRLTWLNESDVKQIIDILKPSFNQKASRTNEYGFVIYPK